MSPNDEKLDIVCLTSIAENPNPTFHLPRNFYVLCHSLQRRARAIFFPKSRPAHLYELLEMSAHLDQMQHDLQSLIDKSDHLNQLSKNSLDTPPPK